MCNHLTKEQIEAAVLKESPDIKSHLPLSTFDDTVNRVAIIAHSQLGKEFENNWRQLLATPPDDHDAQMQGLLEHVTLGTQIMTEHPYASSTELCALVHVYNATQPEST